MKKIIFAMGLLMLISVSQAFGQMDSWNIVKSLSTADKVVVETKQGKTIKGKFLSADDQKISVSKSGKAVDVSKADVSAVYYGKKRRSLIGGVIGGLVGMVVVGGAVSAATDDGTDSGSYPGMAAGAGGLFGGAILGGKLGAKLHKGALIYAAP